MNVDLIEKRMIRPEDAEIMAPVGSLDSLAAAIRGGCDSVYFGVTQLNMRARAADNFGIGDVPEIVGICRKAGVKAYLALNTLLFDHDVAVMRAIADMAKRQGVDAIIGFDFATVAYCGEIGMPVHISVQFSISNYESLAFFSKWTNRVVLARELTLDQIRSIRERILAESLFGNEGRLMEIEAFAHGALCVAQSGRCFMSQYTDNASANRGACRQNCRREYKVTDVETGKELILKNRFVMSAADICTIDFVDEMLRCGVLVLKIEGRGRSPEYVQTVVKVYKDALLAIREGRYDERFISDAYSRLEQVYNRTLSSGNYYLGFEMGQYSTVRGSLGTKKKEYVAKVRNYYARQGIAEIEMEAGVIADNEEFLIIGSTTGVCQGRIGDLRGVDGKGIAILRKGEVGTFSVPSRVRRNDRVYLWKDRDPAVDKPF
jgi:putative protease